MIDLRPLIKDIRLIVQRHCLGETGQYKRWLKQDEANSRDLGATPYGCANAVNILYSIGDMPESSAQRDAFVRILQGFQNQEDGLFHNPGNYETHTTGFVAGALNLLDAKPLYRAAGFQKYLSRDSLYEFLDSIDWQNNPWLGAHLGAGIYASMVLTGTSDDAWEDSYFEWFSGNADPETGLWKKDVVPKAPKFHYLAAAFHYVFNYEYAKRELPYPEQLLRTCISAYRQGECIDFSKEVGWPDIDFSYLLFHAQKRAGTGYRETVEILKEIADGLTAQLFQMDPDTSETLNDLNTLFAIVSALAVLQDALPGYLRTSVPLRLVLDRRPFL